MKLDESLPLEKKNLTCVDLIQGDRSKREAIAQKGYNIFSSLNQSIELQKLVNNL
jgi:hypothetical protein